jgi:uncharacterized membrane protein SpoIIM required for sporulation
MTVGDFEHKNATRWAEYERLVDELERGKPGAEAASLPRRFRELCVDLSLTEFRMYGDRLTGRLNASVIRGYEILYRNRRSGREQLVRFLAVGLPHAVRREWRLFWLCMAVFWLPFLAVMWSATVDLEWVQAILGADGMAAMDQMYGGRESQIEHLRSEYGANFMMFAHYINNNVGIDLQTFAGGIAGGVGALFFLLFNGIYLGAAAGYVNQAGDPESFWTFVSGHSSYEMLGMIVAGMAGMRLGLALLKPGRLPRVRALTDAAKRALPLIVGAMVLTTVAAVVEGFWSAQLLPSALKYGVGIAGWILLGLYFTLAGRGMPNAA